jgi:hypothetical protein
MVARDTGRQCRRRHSALQARAARNSVAGSGAEDEIAAVLPSCCSHRTSGVLLLFLAGGVAAGPRRSAGAGASRGADSGSICRPRYEHGVPEFQWDGRRRPNVAAPRGSHDRRRNHARMDEQCPYGTMGQGDNVGEWEETELDLVNDNGLHFPRCTWWRPEHHRPSAVIIIAPKRRRSKGSVRQYWISCRKRHSRAEYTTAGGDSRVGNCTSAIGILVCAGRGRSSIREVGRR